MANKTFVQNKIESQSKQLFVCSILSVIIDALALIMLIGSGVIDIIMIIALSILLVVGAVQCVFALNSNYRFSYARMLVIAQIILSVAFAIYMICVAAMGGAIDGARYELTYALTIVILWAIIRAIEMVCTVVTLIHASVAPKKVGSIIALVFMGIFAVSTVAFGIIYIPSGFYGQGAGNKVVVYEYYEQTQTYKAKKFLGNGNSVVIPKEFNNKPVTEISYDLFTLTDISNITIHATDFVIADQTVEKLATPVVNSSKKTITAPKAKANSLRNFFFDAGRAHNNGTLFSLGNAVRINDLNDSERAIYYTYGRDENVIASGVTLPITVVTAGAVFNPETLYSSIDYAQNCDASDDTDLLWASENNGGYIFDGFGGLENTAISESKVTPVNFNEVVKLKINADNDDLYELPTTFTKTTGSSHKLVTAETINAKFATAPTRAGFALSWQNSQNANVTSLQSAISSVEANGEFELNPVWKLNAPTISGITGNTSVTYFQAITLSPTATTKPASEFTLSYQWKKDGSVIATGETYQNLNAFPTDSGTYELTVVASSASTSLTSFAKKSVTVAVNPRSLNFVWVDWSDSEKEYDGNDKTIQVTPSGAVNGDVVTFTQTHTTVKDAGSYQVKLTLDSEWTSKYKIAPLYAMRTYVVTPKTLQVTWLDTDLTYNGQNQAPTPTVNPIGSDIAGVEVESKFKDAGSYTFTARFAQNQQHAKNYVLDTATKTTTVAIKKRVISSVVWNETALVYTKVAQYPTISQTNNLVSGETVFYSYQKLTDCVNAGNHTVKAVLNATSARNYTFAGNVDFITREYAIGKKILTDCTWNNTTLTYNGSAQRPDLAVNGVIGTDSLNLTYSGEQTDAGNYTVTATIGNGNYEFSSGISVSTAYEIKPMEIELVWDSETADQVPLASAVISGLEITYKYFDAGLVEIAKPTQNGTYKVQAIISNPNYKISDATVEKEFTITVSNGE